MPSNNFKKMGDSINNLDEFSSYLSLIENELKDWDSHYILKKELQEKVSEAKNLTIFDAKNTIQPIVNYFNEKMFNRFKDRKISWRNDSNIFFRKFDDFVAEAKDKNSNQPLETYIGFLLDDGEYISNLSPEEPIIKDLLRYLERAQNKELTERDRWLAVYRFLLMKESEREYIKQLKTKAVNSKNASHSYYKEHQEDIENLINKYINEKYTQLALATEIAEKIAKKEGQEKSKQPTEKTVRNWIKNYKESRSMFGHKRR